MSLGLAPLTVTPILPRVDALAGWALGECFPGMRFCFLETVIPLVSPLSSGALVQTSVCCRTNGARPAPRCCEDFQASAGAGTVLACFVPLSPLAGRSLASGSS